ncbi:MAG: hypothetical protein ACE5EO_04835 [Candidatus Krumholzibacteriia bacterium]
MQLHIRSNERFLAVSTLAIGVALVATAFATPSDRRSADEKHARDVAFFEEFALSSGGELRVEVGDMDIHVRTGKPGKSSVEVFVSGADPERAREYFEELTFDARLEGNTLLVESREPRHRFLAALQPRARPSGRHGTHEDGRGHRHRGRRHPPG